LKVAEPYCKHTEMYVELTGLLAEITCLECGGQWYDAVRVKNGPPTLVDSTGSIESS